MAPSSRARPTVNEINLAYSYIAKLRRHYPTLSAAYDGAIRTGGANMGAYKNDSAFIREFNDAKAREPVAIAFIGKLLERIAIINAPSLPYTGAKITLSFWRRCLSLSRKMARDNSIGAAFINSPVATLRSSGLDFVVSKNASGSPTKLSDVLAALTPNDARAVAKTLVGLASKPLGESNFGAWYAANANIFIRYNAIAQANANFQANANKSANVNITLNWNVVANHNWYMTSDATTFSDEAVDASISQDASLAQNTTSVQDTSEAAYQATQVSTTAEQDVDVAVAQSQTSDQDATVAQDQSVAQESASVSVVAQSSSQNAEAVQAQAQTQIESLDIAVQVDQTVGASSDTSSDASSEVTAMGYGYSSLSIGLEFTPSAVTQRYASRVAKKLSVARQRALILRILANRAAVVRRTIVSGVVVCDYEYDYDGAVIAMVAESRSGYALIRRLDII